MNSFKKQVDEQMKKHQMQMQEEINQLSQLTEELNIDSRDKLDKILEFAKIYNKLKNDGVIV